MAGKTAVQNTGFDTMKLGVAATLLLIGVGAFYYYEDQSLLYRTLGLLALLAVAIGVSSATEKGRSLLGFLQESRNEVRRMVWPNRSETVQTTLVVFGVVILVGIFLWLVDMFLGWSIRFVIG